ncbi:MAG: hypothetical protein ACREDE_02105 [Thermoplasmata archaeon]
MNIRDWTRAQVTAIAEKHLPGHALTLEEVVHRLASQHEATWKGTSAGVFRPTPSMYALALGWELDKLDPKCALCQGAVQLQMGSAAAAGSTLSIALGPRVPPNAGGLNVPQNLALVHVECLPKG